ncbi:MAG: hypothetical protein WC781_05115 [Candidatus Pacearchaeota archaeon]|jgi:hypothetical protein
MVNKKGWIRIVEAFIAIMLIAAVMTFVYVQKVQKTDPSEELREKEKIILQNIASDDELRLAVVNNNLILINDTIKKYLSQEYIFIFKICNISEICQLEKTSSYYTKNDIIAEDVTISATLTNYSLKKLKLFAWENN